MKSPTLQDCQRVLDTWNAHKRSKRWKTHREVKPDIIEAVKFNIKAGWSIDDICEAIEIFAEVVQNYKYKWTYSKWTLAQFLTRGKRESDLRWTWFHPNNYREEDWLKDWALREKKSRTHLPEELTGCLKDVSNVLKIRKA